MMRLLLFTLFEVVILRANWRFAAGSLSEVARAPSLAAGDFFASVHQLATSDLQQQLTTTTRRQPPPPPSSFRSTSHSDIVRKQLDSTNTSLTFHCISFQRLHVFAGFLERRPPRYKHPAPVASARALGANPQHGGRVRSARPADL